MAIEVHRVYGELDSRRATLADGRQVMWLVDPDPETTLESAGDGIAEFSAEERAAYGRGEWQFVILSVAPVFSGYGEDQVRIEDDFRQSLYECGWGKYPDGTTDDLDKLIAENGAPLVRDMVTDLGVLQRQLDRYISTGR